MGSLADIPVSSTYIFEVKPPRSISSAPSIKMSARTDAEATATQSETGITPATIQATLESQLGATHVDVQDLSGGCGQMFEAVIVSPMFLKKTMLARHRLVNGVLKEEIKAIHAWTPKCFTPEEWEKKKGQAAGGGAVE